MSSSSKWLIASFTAPLLTASLANAGTYFTDTTKVNLLRRYDAATGTLLVSSNQPATNDGHGLHNGNFQDDPMVLQYTLEQAHVVGSFRTNHQGWSWGDDIQVETSTTGFGSMNTIFTVNNQGSPNYNADLPDTVARYYRYTGSDDNNGNLSGWQVMNEYFVYSAANQNISTRDGYDLLSNSSSVTGPEVVTGGTVVTPGDGPFPINNLMDDSMDTYVASRGGQDAYFTVSLDEVYPLRAAHLGFFHTQSWSNGIQIWTSDAAVMPNAASNVGWTLQWSAASASGGTWVPFGANIPVQHVRVNWGATSGALAEFELYALPEPTGLALLGLAGVAMLTRRRGRGATA